MPRHIIYVQDPTPHIVQEFERLRRKKTFLKLKCTFHRVSVIDGGSKAIDEFFYDYAGQSVLCETAAHTAEAWLQELGVTPAVVVKISTDQFNGDIEYRFKFREGTVVPQTLEPWPEDGDP